MLLLSLIFCLCLVILRYVWLLQGCLGGEFSCCACVVWLLSVVYKCCSRYLSFVSEAFISLLLFIFLFLFFLTWLYFVLFFFVLFCFVLFCNSLCSVPTCNFNLPSFFNRRHRVKGVPFFYKPKVWAKCGVYSAAVATLPVGCIFIFLFYA